MRRMTISAIALAISLAPAALAAQTPGMERGPRGPVRGAAVERVIEQREELGLSVQQVAELRRIHTELEEKNRPLLEQLRVARQNVTPEQRAQLRERRSAAADSVRKRLQSITPEQREQMRARRDSMREQMQSMTPEQREQMRERMQNMTPEQRAEMRGRMQQRAGRPGDMPRMRAAVTAELQPVLEQIRANTRAAAEQVHATLTPEQRAKLVELRPARRDPRGR